MMELSLNSAAIEWIDSKRGTMSRQGFIREIIYNNMDATSGEEKHEGTKQTNADGDSQLRRKD